MDPTPAASEPLLLACDVDGTLVGSSRVLSDAARRAIAAVRARGATVVLASGRVPTALVELCRTLQLDGPQITMQGAHIASPLTGEVVSTTTLGADDVRAHLAFARERGVPVLLYYPDRIAAEEFSQEIADLTVAFDEPIPDVVGDLRAFAESRPVKTFLVTGRERRDTIAADARAVFGDRANVTWGDDRSVELLPPGVSKGVALRRLAESLGVERGRVAAVGDGVNDIEMFKYAATSVAMSQAVPAVRAAATTTIDGAGDAFPRVVEYLFPTLRASAADEVSAVREPSALAEDS